MDKAQKGYLILLFLVSPVLGVMTILSKLKNEKALVFFGTLFFGLVGSVFVYMEGTDGYSHLMNAKQYYTEMSFAEFFRKAYEVITFSSTEVVSDIYLHIISYISTSVLRNPALIHVFTGLVLGYFFTKSVILVLKGNLKTKKSTILTGLIVLFLLIKSIEALNSIRMWTGMWVLFYGSYSYAITKKKKYFFVILFSVFIHFSYLVILIPVVLVYTFQRQKKIIFLLYIISFFSSVGFSFFESYIPDSKLFEKRQSTYTIDSEEKVERFQEDNDDYKAEISKSNFYKALGQSTYVNYSIVGLSFILLLFYFKKEADRNLDFLISVGIGLYSFANFVAFTPELHGRSKIIACTFILAAAIHLQFTIKKYGLSQKNIKIVNKGFAVFLISAVPIFLLQISDIMFNISFFIFLFPEISWILGDDDYSIRKMIGLIID